jgi:hypothetical protein
MANLSIIIILRKIMKKNLYKTCGIQEAITKNPKFANFCHNCWLRFIDHDWGDISEEGKRNNDGYPDYKLASYIIPDDILKEGGIAEKKIWLIYAVDHTIVVFPSEY